MNPSRALVPLLAAAALAALLLWGGGDEPAEGGALPAPATPREALAERRSSESREQAPAPSTRTAAPARTSAPGAADERSDAPLLELRFVTRQGAPIPRVGFEIYVEGDRAEGRRGPRWTVQADEEGRAILEVVTGRALSVWVDPTEEHGWGELELEPLGPGERIARTLELPTGLDLDWYVRVEEAGRAVSGASVVALEEDERGERIVVEATATDVAGLAHFRCRSWRERDVRIAGPDRGIAMVLVTEGHRRPADALVVQLWPTATLRARVVDANGLPVEGAHVSAEVWGFQLGPPNEDAATNAKHRVEAVSGDEGLALLERLPAGLALDLAIERDGRELVRETQETPLDAGETVERQYVVGGEGAVIARVVDPTGAPVGGAEVWALPGPPGDGHARVLDRERDGARVVARAMTAADGRAALEPLPLGRWTIGAVPREHDASAVAELARGSLAPFVELTAEEPVAEITLRLAPPLAIAGRVLDEEGNGLGDLELSAGGEDFGCWRTARSDADGAFRLAPLPAGRYSVRVDVGERPWVPAQLQGVEAGTEDLELVLRRGGTLRGLVRDATTGEPAGEVVVRAYAVASERPYVIRAHQLFQGGAFELGGLDAGPHALVAETMDGRLGILDGLRVARGEELDGLELRVAPGVPVRVRYAGALPECDVLVTQAGVKISYVRYRPGQLESFLAPPGPLEIVVEGEGRERERFEREAEPGRELEIVVE